MTKINFNVPFRDLNGEPIREAKTNKEKQRLNANGQMVPDVIVDENENIVFEEISFKQVVQSILLAPYQGDENLEFGVRVKRGKLAKKVATSSTANYRPEELVMITELAAKSKATLVLLQLDELINGEEVAIVAADSEQTH